MMNTKPIVFLTSSHSPYDDRILNHQAFSLSAKNRIIIVSTTENTSKTLENITIIGNKDHINKSNKITFFKNILKENDPDIIICSEPLTVYAANKYRKENKSKSKIIFDVTEWYPSKKNLENQVFLKQVFILFKLLIFNIYASSKCDAFIFGEYYKSLIYRFLFFTKKWIEISYFPDLNQIHYAVSHFNKKKICLGYTGRISIEKGIDKCIHIVAALKELRPETIFKLKIIGYFINKKDHDIFNKLRARNNNFEIELLGSLPYDQFSKKIQDIDILLDLRKCDLENNNCLPIKVFFYAACGKPVIYTNLKAIRRVIDVNQFGYLVNPENIDNIAQNIVKYIDQPSLYEKHSKNARMLSESKYNWHFIEPRFLNFITSIQS